MLPDANNALSLGRVPRLTVDLGIVAGLMLLTFIPYWPVGGFDFVALDDTQYVTQSELVRHGLEPLALWGALTEVHADNWHPLVWWSLMLDVELFGVRPGPMHCVNVGWHLVNVGLLYGALRTLTGDRSRSAVVAALFGVHPVHVESVAWISERKDVLSGACWMAALWCYALWATSRRSGWWWGVTIALGLGLMAKQILVTLPCVFLLLDFWPLGRLGSMPADTNWPRRAVGLVREKLVWIGLCGASLLAALQAQQQARLHAEDWPLELRVSNALLSYVRYLGKLFWPVELSLPYPYNVPESLWPVGICAALLLIITGLALCLVRRDPAGLVGWLWYLGVLVPVVGIVQLGQQAMADRYLYLPLAGIALAIVWSCPAPRTIRQSTFATVSVASVLVALTIRTAQQVSVWRNTRTLFEHALAVDPTNDAAHYILAADDLQAGRLAAGIDHLQTAVTWERRRWEARRTYRGRLPPANTPTYDRHWADLYFQIGTAHIQLGRQQEAVEMLREAVHLDPRFIDARLMLASTLVATHQVEAARAQYDAVLQLQPGHPQAEALRARLPL